MLNDKSVFVELIVDGVLKTKGALMLRYIDLLLEPLKGSIIFV